MGVPDIAGALCLILAMCAFQALPIGYTGVALLVLGIALMVAEAQSPSFGVLELGGIITLVIGSIILMDTDLPSYQIALPAIAAFGVFNRVFTLVLVHLLLKSRR